MVNTTMKLDEILDPKQFALRLSQSSNKLPDRVKKLIAVIKKHSEKGTPRTDDLRHADEVEEFDKDAKIH